MKPKTERFSWPKKHTDESLALAACELRKKELKAQGYKVSRKRTSFEGLGYGGMYTLTAMMVQK